MPSPEFLLLVKHLRIKLIDLRDLAEDQMGHDLLDVLDRVITHAVEAEPNDDHFGLLIACERESSGDTIGVHAVRLD